MQASCHTHCRPMTDHHPLRVLFLCNRNTARSIMAEAILTHIGATRFQAYSAGASHTPDQVPHPLALQVLHDAGMSTEGLHSKSWHDFAGPDAPHMDLVITLCDQVHGETCPVWPGHPATAHWSYEDPALPQPNEAEALYVFKRLLHALHQRLELLMNLPLQSLDRMVLETEARRLAATPAN